MDLVVAALPIDPPTAKHCWGFYAVNLGSEPIQIDIEEVSYEWGDFSNSEEVNTLCGPIAPGASLEIYRETSTEMRTGLTMTVTCRGSVRRVYAEVSRLYQKPSGVEAIPELGGRLGKRAELSSLPMRLRV